MDIPDGGFQQSMDIPDSGKHALEGNRCDEGAGEVRQSKIIDAHSRFLIRCEVVEVPMGQQCSRFSIQPSLNSACPPPFAPTMGVRRRWRAHKTIAPFHPDQRQNS